MSKKDQKYVCECFEITKADIKAHIKNGVVKYKDLQAITNIGTQCSSCKTKTKAKFKKYKEQLSAE